MKTNIPRFTSIVSVLLLTTCFLPAFPAHASVPKLLTYQGILKDSSGNFLTGTYSMTYRIYSAATGGTSIWSETQSPVSATSGRFNVQLGSVTALNLTFDQDYWLSVQVGTDSEMTPRQRLTSAGYALMAESVVNGFTQAQHDALSHKNIKGVRDNTVNIAKTNFKLDAYSLAVANSMGDMIVDSFNDATGIHAASSSNYTWRGSPNYDVVVYSTYDDQSGAGTATASGSYSGNWPAKAFDNIAHSSNEWSSDSVPSASAPSWLQYDFGGGVTKKITRYTLTNAEGYGYNRSRAPKDWTFEGSNDGTSWTVLQTQSGVSWDCDTCTKPFDVSNNTSYRYYRLKITANNGGPTFVEVAEVELMAQTTSGNATVVSIAYSEATAPTEAMVIADEALNTGGIAYSVSRDNGVTWTSCPKDTVVNINSQPSGTQVRWKSVISGDAQLKAMAVAL